MSVIQPSTAEVAVLTAMRLWETRRIAYQFHEIGKHGEILPVRYPDPDPEPLVFSADESGSDGLPRGRSSSGDERIVTSTLRIHRPIPVFIIRATALAIAPVPIDAEAAIQSMIENRFLRQDRAEHLPIPLLLHWNLPELKKCLRLTIARGDEDLDEVIITARCGLQTLFEAADDVCRTECDSAELVRPRGLEFTDLGRGWADRISHGLTPQLPQISDGSLAYTNPRQRAPEYHGPCETGVPMEAAPEPTQGHSKPISSAAEEQIPNPSAPHSLERIAEAWGGEMTAKKLRPMIGKTIKGKALNRQTWIVSLDDVPVTARKKLAPTDTNSLQLTPTRQQPSR